MASHRPPAVECFDPSDLQLLRGAIDDAWSRIASTVPSGSENAVREAMSVAIFDMARAGQRDPERLWCYAVIQGRSAVRELLTARTLT